VDVRPRTLGEILDDACRSALADAPVLLFFNALFLLPAFAVVLVLSTVSTPSGIAQVVLPACAALLLPLTGLASGACQELFRRRAKDEPVAVRSCLIAALRRGLEHAAARGVLLVLTLPGPLMLINSFLPDTSPIWRFLGFLFGAGLTFLFSVPLWGAATSLSALLSAGAARSGSLPRELRRDVAAAPGKAAVLVLLRLPLLLLFALQLHLLLKIVLWGADNLAGFDTALLDVELAFLGNPLYTIALFLLTWLVLTPFFESCNFLLHTDIRTRQEGLDLQYRVQRAFGGMARTGLVLMGLLLAGSPLRAATEPLDAVRSVRREIETIRAEIQKAEPYPGGRRWLDRLRGLSLRLAQANGGAARRSRWFDRAIEDFGDRKKDDALRILDEVHRRLSLLEDSLTPPAKEGAGRSAAEVKSMLRGSEGRKIERSHRRPRVEEERVEIRREEGGDEENRPQQPAAEGPRPEGGRGVSTPGAGGGGLSSLGWLLLAGVALAVVAVGVFFYLHSPRHARSPKSDSPSGAAKSLPDNDARQVLEETPETLWRQADALADEGRFREAVRLVYLAVLAQLHRRHLIRFEPTRTNGEYVRQIHLSEQAPPQLHESFPQLTERFETAWYGERPCEAADYRASRALADQCCLK
jgi:hypothetical protein